MSLVASRSVNKRTRQNENLKTLHRVRQTKHDLIRKRILKDRRIDILAKLVGYRWDAFHQTLWEFYEAHKSELALGPRGWGKTTTDTVMPLVLEILCDPNCRNLLGSETVTQAEDFLSEVKAILTHKNLKAVFGDLRGNKWNDSEITVRGRTRTSKESTVMCTGVDSAVTSKHFDHIFIDDLVSLKSSRTVGGRKKTYDWYYATLLPCITDEFTTVRIRGTRYHPDDMYGHLMTHDPQFMDSTIVIPALTEDDISNNPDIYSTEFLLKLRSSWPRVIWNSQYQQDPSGVQGSIFSEDHFRHVNELPRGLVYFIGVDLATGKKKDVHAKKAVAVIGIHPMTFRIYIADYVAGHMSEKQLDKVIEEMHTVWSPVLVSVEANAYQASKIENLEDNPETSHIVFYPVFTQYDKPTRARRLAARYERGHVFHMSQEKGGELESHLMGVPDSGQWDLFDSVDIAIQGAISKKTKKKKRKREPTVISGGGRRRFRN